MSYARRLFVAFALVLVQAGSGQSQPFFSEKDILVVSPRADRDLVRTLVDNQTLLSESDISSRLRVAHFLAQVFTETGGLSRLDENLNYSADRLLRVFSRKVITPAKAREIEHQPRQIANWIYGNRLGNRGRDTDDGWRYRGSGYIQLTGRDNFVRRGAEIGLPIVDNPDIARDPIAGLKAATAYWLAREINEAADLNDRLRVRVLVNGPAAHGAAVARTWFNLLWVKVFASRAPFGEELAWVESSEIVDPTDIQRAIAEILSEEGFLDDAGAVESAGGGEAYSEALRAYQTSRGLSETGVLDEDTLYAITDPSEWRDLEAAEYTAAPMVDPDGTASFALDGNSEEAAPVLEGKTKSIEPIEAELASAGLDIDELTSFAGAAETYSEYELAEGRYEGDNFIPFTVIGDDNREPVLNTTQFPESAIVQIVFKKVAGIAQNLCTGAMISPDTVLTAGHCVHSGTAIGHWYQDFIVYPGRNTDTKPFGECHAVRLLALRGWIEAATNADARLYDMAALKLDCDVGSRTGWFGVRAMGDEELGAQTKLQGYAGDRSPTGRQWVSLDQVRVLQQLKAFYQNDSFGGTSGAPVTRGSDPQIFCVHTNGLHGSPPWSENNACTRITPDRMATIAGWIEP
ncbi:trypsin-like serine protease [Rhodobacteraceae bacterium DSL-40]|uniref:trypsin-like serine protease n=1 Tax=Amaricoccus sp. B4 TaxID=3368557 RepID=UPI0013A6C246